MRFPFGPSAFILTLFLNHIGVSTGMNRRENQGKTLNLFGETPESLGRKSKQSSTLRLVQDDKGQLRLFDEDTRTFVDDEPIGKLEYHEHTRVHRGGQKTRRVDPLPKLDSSIQTDVSGKMRLFNHGDGRFDEDSKPYEPGTDEYNLAQEIQMSYRRDSKSNQKASSAKSKWIFRNDERANEGVYNTATFDNNNSVKDNHELLPRISVAGGYRADVLNQPLHEQSVSTPRRGQVNSARPDPQLINPGHHGIYDATSQVQPNVKLSRKSAFNPYNPSTSGSSGSDHQH